MSYGYIYKIQFPNGKHYIGLTSTSLEQRTKEHTQCAKKGDTKCLYNALRKYNIVDTFKLIEIDTADTLEELCEKEIRYIEEYNSYYKNGNGYNMTYGGEGTNGYIHTEEYKQKKSEITIKYYEDNPNAGKEHGQKMTKYFENPEAKQKQSERLKKYNENPEAKQKQSEAQKKYHEDNPDAGKKQSERLKKYHEDNPDAGKEHGKVLKTTYENNPEKRQKHSEIKKKHLENPEARQKLSDGKGKNKPFDVFTIDGTFIKTFNYQFKAKEYLQKEYNITSTIKISEVLAENRNSSAGFVFKFKPNIVLNELKV